ncbi:carbon-nitrogen hydrolase family protein [Verrucomicrobiota bacterium sgz303538]
MFSRYFLLAAAAALFIPPSSHAASNLIDDSWQHDAPREEIAPKFSIEAKGGRNGTVSLVLETDSREGLSGYWSKTVPVQGGQHYRFTAWRKADGVSSPRRSVVARILWQDAAGKPVPHDGPIVTSVLMGWKATAEPEYPTDHATDPQGWTEVSDVYRAPSSATQARIELHLQWAPRAKAYWSDVTLDPVAQPAGRKVRLAAVHYRPQGGKTPEDNCHQFAPLVAEAAKQHADLVVLPETLTYYGLGKSYADCAEPVPGPSTEYFGTLAREQNLYIVAGLIEREGHLIYNVAALIGPDGKLVGKYRKVALPRSEISGGITPGSDYPVFNTRFGKLGMMVCYDGFFPEVARELTNRGAEVIAWPVWGCNPMLASARACENQVYLVSSTYEDVSRNWILTAVWGHDGQPLVHAEKWGSVVVSEVDLDQRLQWPSLGDFKAELPRHRPLSVAEPKDNSPLKPVAAVVKVDSLSAPEANQAAAADDRFVYAIDSAVVAKYDRATGQRLALSTGKAKHLNSGFLWNGKLYCAHSNYPQKPEKSEIMVVDLDTMVLTPFKDFGEYRGSLTWAVHEGNSWWCTFAHYGAENAKTALVKLDENRQEQGAWTYPPEVIKELGQYSISGGIWKDGYLLATGHDHRVIYRLRLPENGTVLELVDVLSSPFPGQGIAVDPKTGGLVGIDRDKRQVVFGELRK